MEETKTEAEHYHPNRRHLVRTLAYDTIRLAILVIIIGLAILVWHRHVNSQNRLPSSLTKSVNYTLYYPKNLPPGYRLDKATAKSQNGIVFFSITSDNNNIVVSEQVLPPSPPTFETLQKFNTNFKKIDNISGQIIYGTSQKVPVAFLITNTTLVNITGSQNTPLDAVVITAQNMASL